MMKQDIVTTLSRAEFEYVGAYPSSEDENGFERYYVNFCIFNQPVKITVDIRKDISEVTVDLDGKEHAFTFNNAVVDPIKEIQSGNQGIVDAIYQHLCSAPKGRKKNKHDVKEEQREYLTEWSREEQDCILNMVADFSGYHPNQHWGWMAIKCIAQLDRSTMLSPVIVSGLIEWRAASDVFTSANSPDFQVETHFPSHGSIDSGKDSMTLGSVFETIESIVAMHREGNRIKIDPRRVTYVVEILINTYYHLGDLSELQVNVDVCATDSEGCPTKSTIERIHTMVEKDNPLHRTQLQKPTQHKEKKAQARELEQSMQTGKR